MTEHLVCNADGITHDSHVWDFGSGETFICPGFPPPDDVRACTIPPEA